MVTSLNAEDSRIEHPVSESFDDGNLTASCDDDNWESLAEESRLFYNFPVTGERVDGDDLIDYYLVSPDYAGCYDFVLSGIDKSSSLTLSVWQQNGDKLKLVKKVTSSKKTEISIAGLLLDMSETYYVSVETKSGKKVVGSDYTLAMNGEEFWQGVNSDDDWQSLDTADDSAYFCFDCELSDWVGFGDAADYRILSVQTTGCYSFSLKDLDKAAQVTLTVWQQDGDNLKSVKSVTVKGKTEGGISDLILEAGNQYYISVEAKNAAQGIGTDYLLLFRGEEYFRTNNSDDDYRTLNGGYSMGCGYCEEGEWLGISDSVDYRKLELNYSGSYTVSVDGFDKNIALTLTLWQLQNGKLKSLKSLSLKGKTAGEISDVLLDASEEYYVSVAAKSLKAGQSTDYNIAFGGTEFVRANPLDDTVDSGYNQTIFYQSSIVDEWVGFGDTVDYHQIDVTQSGSFDFTLSGVDKSAQLVLTVYQLNNGKLKSLKSVTVKSKTEGTLSGIELTAGDSYFVSVANKGSKASDYTLYMDGEIFMGNVEDDNWKTLSGEYRLADGEVIENEWLGLHDLVDYRALEVNCNGLYKFTVAGAESDAQLALTVWQQNGTKLKSVKSLTVKNGAEGVISGLKLSQSESYFVSVEIKNAKNCPGTGYALGMSLEAEILADNTDDTWAKASKLNRFADTDNIAEWVGKGDSTDWFRFDITDSKYYEWDFNLGEGIETTFYKLNGKKLVEVVGDSGNLTAGTYALEITMAKPTEDGVRYNVYFVPSNSWLEASVASVF